ncbi:hypothetical protein D3C73_1136390 [compost metagenome]
MPIGTIRSLPDAALQRTNFSPVCTSSTFSEISSETRMPVAYSSSSIALSRMPCGPETTGAASRRSMSSMLRIIGVFLLGLIISISSVGSCSITRSFSK